MPELISIQEERFVWLTVWPMSVYNCCSQPVACKPWVSHVECPAYGLFPLQFISVAKLVMKLLRNNFVVGHEEHGIKGLQNSEG